MGTRANASRNRRDRTRRTEEVNPLVKRIKRVGFGFRNFTNYRLRLPALRHDLGRSRHDPDPRAATTRGCEM
jgi:hypothetical protein